MYIIFCCFELLLFTGPDTVATVAPVARARELAGSRRSAQSQRAFGRPLVCDCPGSIGASLMPTAATKLTTEQGGLRDVEPCSLHA